MIRTGGIQLPELHDDGLLRLADRVAFPGAVAWAAADPFDNRRVELLLDWARHRDERARVLERAIGAGRASLRRDLA